MNKFWNRSAGHNRVTHREIGDIPECTPAPLNSIYQPVALEVAIATNAARAERFSVALDTDQYGPSFRGSSFAEPLYGPYGEQL